MPLYRNTGISIENVLDAGLNTTVPDAYTALGSIALTPGSYLISYSVQVTFPSGSGVADQDVVFMDIATGGTPITDSEISMNYVYTVVGVVQGLRVMSWVIKVVVATSATYDLRVKKVSNTGLAPKYNAYSITTTK